MAQRIAYGALSISVLLILFMTESLIAARAFEMPGPIGELLRRGSVIPAAFLFFFLLGAVEFLNLLQARGAQPYRAFTFIMIALLLLTPWLSAAGWLGSGAAHVEGVYWQVVWLMVAALGVGLGVVFRGNPAGSLRDAGTTLLAIMYLGFLGSFGVQICCGRDFPELSGVWVLLITVLVTKASDIGAYFVGSMLGRHKLCPSISPAKSIEGAIGGLLASAGAGVLLVAGGMAMITVPEGETSGPDGVGFRSALGLFIVPHASIPFLRAAIFGICMSISGQLGDLLESCFKRDACVKDSGRIMPRFGGILDLIDSPVLSMPVAWFLLTAVWSVQ